MKKLIVFLVFLIILITFSCNRNKYRYKIHGKIYIPTSGLHPIHDAIWYTDTISFDGDTLYYFNSDGSKVTIRPPYTLIDNTKQTIKRN
jgi:hypothetical protein